MLLIPEYLAVQRVAYRVQAGGHPVAESKIRERYHRLWALVAEAIMRCEQATVYDNSGIKGPRIVAQMTEGMATVVRSFPDLRDQWRGCRFLKSSAMVSKLAQVTPSWELM